MNGENWFLTVVAVCATAITALVIVLRHVSAQRKAQRSAQAAARKEAGNG